MSTAQFVQVHLFIDVSKESQKSRQIVDYLDKNIKRINFSGVIVEAVPIITKKDKEVLLGNGVTSLPTLLNDKKKIVGLNNIVEFLNSKMGKSNRPKELSPQEQLRQEQMADMDMNKFEAGEYDDEDNYDDEEVFRGDPDAIKQNVQRKISEFNKRRKGRVEDDPNAAKKNRKKNGNKNNRDRARNKEPDADDLDQYEDNVEPAPKNRGKGGGSRGDRGTTDVNFEDWDAETQQLLDKGGGGDW